MILNLHDRYYGLHDFGFLHVTDMATASEAKASHIKAVFFKGNKKNWGTASVKLVVHTKERNRCWKQLYMDLICDWKVVQF